MGKTREDEAYDRGREAGKNSDFFDELTHNFNPLKGYGSSDRAYEGGYKEGVREKYESSGKNSNSREQAREEQVEREEESESSYGGYSSDDYSDYSSSSSSSSGSSSGGIGFFGWALIIGGLVALGTFLERNQQRQYPAATQYQQQSQSYDNSFGPISWFKISNKNLNSIQQKNPLNSDLASDVNKMLSNSPQKYYRVIKDEDRNWDQYCYNTFVLPQRKNNKSYPYIVKGDFNGDGIFDIAAIVAEKDFNNERLAIILSGKDDSDIMFFENQWGDAIELFQERHVNSRWEQPALDLKGDAIHRRRYESASRLIYWNGSAFKEYQMSD